MADPHCATCTCSKKPPDYPVTCPRCGITYGPEGEVGTHRPGGPVCIERIAATGATSKIRSGPRG